MIVTIGARQLGLSPLIVKENRMLTTKQSSLRPLLESHEGLHLTLYLVNRGSITDLRLQVRSGLAKANKTLASVMSDEERVKFLEPIKNLLEDSTLLRQMHQNIGLFRNSQLFRILNVPVHVEQSCQIATTFHVKPLISWMQSDQDFLVLGLKEDSADLYYGTQNTLKLVDSILFPDIFKSTMTEGDYDSLKKGRYKKILETKIFVWLSDWIDELTKSSKPKLFVAGSPSQCELMFQKLDYKNVWKPQIANFFSLNNLSQICLDARKHLKEESKLNLQRVINEFRCADERKKTSRNIFQIAKAVVKGRVRKLVVTDELNIFGKIDLKTGGLAIHPDDLDHEDDCIMDDLAQMVLSQGGEVIIAKRDQIPSGKPILAILEDGGPNSELILQKELYHQKSG